MVAEHCALWFRSLARCGTSSTKADLKTKFEDMTELDLKQQSPNDAKPVLAAAASWWGNLTTFKRELYIGRHYSDDTPTPDKINTLYKMYNDWSNYDLEQVSSCH